MPRKSSAKVSTTQTKTSSPKRTTKRRTSSTKSASKTAIVAETNRVRLTGVQNKLDDLTKTTGHKFDADSVYFDECLRRQLDPPWCEFPDSYLRNCPL